MTKILYFALKIKGGGREGGTCEVLRPCHPLNIWNVHQSWINRLFGTLPLVLTYFSFVQEINPSFDVFNIFIVIRWHTVQEFC